MNDLHLAQFFKRRALLNQSLDASRGQLDTWISEHVDSNPSVADLAQLQGLMGIRGQVFAELAALDDGLVEYLLKLRGQLEA